MAGRIALGPDSFRVDRHWRVAPRRPGPCARTSRVVVSDPAGLCRPAWFERGPVPSARARLARSTAVASFADRPSSTHAGGDGTGGRAGRTARISSAWPLAFLFEFVVHAPTIASRFLPARQPARA